MALAELNDLVGKLPELKAEHERLGKLIDAIEAFAQNGDAVPNMVLARAVWQHDCFLGGWGCALPRWSSPVPAARADS